MQQRRLILTQKITDHGGDNCTCEWVLSVEGTNIVIPNCVGFGERTDMTGKFVDLTLLPGSVEIKTIMGGIEVAIQVPPINGRPR